MNIERALNIYRTYTVTKIAALDKQNLAMQYAQCGELVKLQKQIDRANQTSLSILRNQEKELKRQEAQRYYKSLAFNLNKSLAVISECNDEVKRCFLSDLYLAPISAFADICENKVDEIADKEYASEIKKKADDLSQEASKYTKQYEQSLYYRLKELNEQKQSNAISNEIIEKKKQLAVITSEASVTKKFKSTKRGGCCGILWGLTLLLIIGVFVDEDYPATLTGILWKCFLFLILAVLTYFTYIESKEDEKIAKKEKGEFDKQTHKEKVALQVKMDNLQQEIEELQEQRSKIAEEYNSTLQMLSNNDSAWTKEIDELTSLLPEESEDKEQKFGPRKTDSLMIDAARMIVISQQGSTSLIQRKFSIGYNKCGRIMDQLEALGIVGKADGSKPREVLVRTEEELNNILKLAHILE